MRVLLSTIGSRGDIQPLVALASALKSIGQDVHLCVPPDFREWIESLDLRVTPIGPELRKLTASSGAPAGPPTPERARQMVADMIAGQFDIITEAAKGCDVIVGATALQIAPPSIAELLRIPYVFVAYCPTVLPSLLHAPPPLYTIGPPLPPTTDNAELWARSAARFNDTFRDLLNEHRQRLRLAPVTDMQGHVLTDHPWLAADPALGPWPEAGDDRVFQPGAWIVRDERPLAPELESFLAGGDAPVYFGFGSMRATPNLGTVVVEAARAIGRRAVVSRGWADIALTDNAPDCLAIDDVNHHALFPRVAAIVHHGGAGTTTSAALSGTPQVIVPQMYDQSYWAQRVHDLGIGVAHPRGAPALDTLTTALRTALEPSVVATARAFGAKVRTDGALRAAARLHAAYRRR